MSDYKRTDLMSGRTRVELDIHQLMAEGYQIDRSHELELASQMDRAAWSAHLQAIRANYVQGRIGIDPAKPGGEFTSVSAVPTQRIASDEDLKTLRTRLRDPEFLRFSPDERQALARILKAIEQFEQPMMFYQYVPPASDEERASVHEALKQLAEGNIAVFGPSILRDAYPAWLASQETGTETGISRDPDDPIGPGLAESDRFSHLNLGQPQEESWRDRKPLF